MQKASLCPRARQVPSPSSIPGRVIHCPCLPVFSRHGASTQFLHLAPSELFKSYLHSSLKLILWLSVLPKKSNFLRCGFQIADAQSKSQLLHQLLAEFGATLNRYKRNAERRLADLSALRFRTSSFKNPLSKVLKHHRLGESITKSLDYRKTSCKSTRKKNYLILLNEQRIKPGKPQRRQKNKQQGCQPSKEKY